MKETVAILTAVSIAILTACSNKTDANEKNFGAAMEQFFDKRGDLCLDTTEWPVDFSELDVRLQKTMKDGKSNRMAVLESIGLVQGEDVEVERTGLLGTSHGAKIRVRRYSLTKDAAPFIKERRFAPGSLAANSPEKVYDLCWGKRTLDKIVKWEGPIKFGNYQKAGVTYTYRVDNVADWARRPDVQAAFPSVKRELTNAGNTELKHAIKLTCQGWEAKGLY